MVSGAMLRVFDYTIELGLFKTPVGPPGSQMTETIAKNR
jgi:hypothetical protein